MLLWEAVNTELNKHFSGDLQRFSFDESQQHRSIGVRDKNYRS